MLRSIANVYGDRVLVAILTGMGQDGMLGARAVVERGGTIIAQDEDTSVVWGMPGAVATTGLCSAVVPLGTLGQTIEKVIAGLSL
jgi:two-component system chemotaxis response regulator CheB